MGEKPTAIVVGAGIGGVACAARLARAGFAVTVIEKHPHSGGRCSLLRVDGYRFDVGPSFYLMRETFAELFQDLGEKVEDWYELVKCEPNYRVHFHDGIDIELSTDMTRMKEQVELYEGKDGWERFLAFLKEAHIHYEVSLKEVLHRNFGSFFSLIRLRYLVMALRIHVFDRMYRRASTYFWSDRLRRAFTFSSMYLGMSPFNAPATYNLLQYTELAQGIWYPLGGFHKVVESLETIAKRNGATFRFSSSVRSIDCAAGTSKASGVTLDSGERIDADLIVCNADLVYAYSKLLPTSRYSKALAATAKLTCSSISFYWGLNEQVSGLEVHNIFLAEDFEGSFDRIFDDHALPDEPSFYVNVPSRVDKTAAPDGKDALVVLVPVGHLLDDASDALNVEPRDGTTNQPRPSQDWNAIVARARNHVLQILSAHLKRDVALLINVERMHTPLSWRDDLNLHKGAILGLSHGIFQVLSFRPRIRHDTISDLYFVGASTHPGTGVPVVVCGSKITSESILKDRGMSVPWRKAKVKNEARALDVIRTPRWTPPLWLLVLVAGIALGSFLPWPRRPGIASSQKHSIRWEHLPDL